MGADARAGLLGTPAPGPHATALPACRGFAPLCTATVGRVCKPCEVLVAPDRGVVTVNEDNFVVLRACHPGRPSTKLSTSMFGYRPDARSSAIRWMLFPGVLRFLPIRADRRARTYRELRRPPRRTWTRTTAIPCLALYPRERARSIRVGRSIRVTLPSRRHSCIRSQSMAFTSDLSGLAHASLTYAYIDFTICYNTSRFGPSRATFL